MNIFVTLLSSQMKKILVLFILFALHGNVFSQIDIGIGPSAAPAERNKEQIRKLLKESYIMTFYHSAGDSIADSILIHNVVLMNLDYASYCIMYKDDTTKVAIAILKLKSQKGYRVSTYRLNGSLKRISNYDKNIVLSGKWEEYYASGFIRIKGEYCNGKKVKKWKYYDENGRRDSADKH